MSADTDQVPGPAFHVRLPEGWEQVDPAASGTPDLEFAALRLDAMGSATRPSITVTSFTSDRRPEPDELAERATTELAARVARVAVLDRRQARGDGPPSTTQVLSLHIDADDGSGPGVSMVQIMTFLVVPLRADSGGDRAAVVLELTATCAPEHLQVVGGEFERFLGSVRLTETATDEED